MGRDRSARLGHSARREVPCTQRQHEAHGCCDVATSPAASKTGPKTIGDWSALPADARYELIDGELVEKAVPTFEHGLAQRNTASALGGPYGRRVGGPGGPGGWWIVTEVDIHPATRSRDISW
jgi:hypothetical protein